MPSKFYNRIACIRPTVILLSYVGLIPVFAVLFCVLPSQNFYAPFAVMEPLAIVDSKKVQENIVTSMRESYREHDYSLDSWQIARSDLDVGDLKAEDSKSFSFTVYYFATRHQGGEIVGSTGGPQFSAHLSQLKIRTPSEKGREICHLVEVTADKIGNPSIMPNQHLLFHSNKRLIQGDAVCWGYEEEIALQNLLAGWSGNPRGLSGFFERMLCFSATTITTVGFGDIVPITATARMLVALEAIMGWVFAGLFLNSLASRIARDRS